MKKNKNNDSPPADDAILLSDYRESAYDIRHVELEFNLAAAATRVTSTLSVKRRVRTRTGTPLILDGEDIELLDVKINGKALQPGDYEAGPQSLTIFRPPGISFRLHVTTQINPSENRRLSGLFLSNGIFCTQCEAEGFRRITYFCDRPDILATWRVKIIAPRHTCPVLLSNGNPVESGTVPGTDTHYAIWEDPHRKPSYLFALVAGDLAMREAQFTTASGCPVTLRIYVSHGHEPQTRWAMDSLIRAMKWDERRYGREYDLDMFNIVAVADFNMGAMENKGLNIFNQKYILADRQTATDRDYRFIESVVAHEYFHNWTGNRITCRDWFQLCLKEGLTVFRDQEFTSEEYAPDTMRIDDVRRLKNAQFEEDASPLAHCVRPGSYKAIDNFYTATVYLKGAEIIRMLKLLIGPLRFRRAMDSYFERHDGQAVTVEDFLSCFAGASGTNLDQFALWYDRPGTPGLKVRYRQDIERQELTLFLAQEVPGNVIWDDPRPMVIPVRFGLVDVTGIDAEYESLSGARASNDVIIMDGWSHEVVFKGVTQRVIPSVLRGFSAPVAVEFELDDEQQAFLARHDQDRFNRQQAVQAFARRTVFSILNAPDRDAAGDDAGIDAKGEPPQRAQITILAEILATIAADTQLACEFRAACIAPPKLREIFSQGGAGGDPARIFAARNQLRSAIGARNRDGFEDVLGTLTPDGAYSPDPGPAGRRALAHELFRYLAACANPGARGESVIAHRLYTAFQRADNMTDRLAYLGILTDHGMAGGKAALKEFFARHKDDPVCLDNWFACQARIPLDSGFETVCNLARHPAFNITNPNRARALAGVFAFENLVQFNRPDGRGYRFVADLVVAIDAQNPQMAAWLLNAFRILPQLNTPARAQMTDVLGAIQGRPALSRNSRDIVDRLLAEPHES